MHRIYLDHLSTTPVDPQVIEAMEPFLKNHPGNPGSIHQEGIFTRDALSAARETMARFLSTHPEDLIFTSSGTEALNMAVKGIAWGHQRHGNHLIYSATEHVAITRSIEFLETQGFTSTRIPVDALGRVDIQSLQAAVTDKTILIAVHQANHEIGTIQPLRAIGDFAEERGIPFLVDATVTAGWMPCVPHDLKASLLVLSPHRFYGPKGVGVLYRHRSCRLIPLLHGGNQEEGRRAGTENVAAIVGAAKAAELASGALAQGLTDKIRLKQTQWLADLQQSIPGIRLLGPPPGQERVPHALNLALKGVEGEGVVLLADMQGLAISSGSACLGHSLRLSPVLNAIGLDPVTAQSNIILSLGRETTDKELQEAVQILARVVDKLKRMSPPAS